VDEPHATVQLSMTPPGGTAVTMSRHAAVAAGQSVTLASATFATPGLNYQLSVNVVLPPAQTVTARASLQQTLSIAPGT
jgi:hypothetical protein